MTQQPADLQPSGMRINKYLAGSGFCSRREADRLIAGGAVTIDGAEAKLGARVQEGQIVCVNGQPITQNQELLYIAFYKPRGIICTTDLRWQNNIIDYLSFDQRIFPVGRLDKDSEGLIFLTNDGQIVNKILKSRNFHEKEYRVTVDKPITDEFLNRMSQGVPILNTITRPCQIWAESQFVFRIILTQGLNRQIRRMCETCGYSVRKLVRIRIMHITLDQLKPGQWRPFTDEECAKLKCLIEDSDD